MFSILCNKIRSILKGRGNPQPIPPFQRYLIQAQVHEAFFLFIAAVSSDPPQVFFFFSFLTLFLLLFPILVSFKKDFTMSFLFLGF